MRSAQERRVEVLIHTRLQESVGKKLISPCKLRDLRVSVLKLLRKRSTTEARRTRRNLFPTDSFSGFRFVLIRGGALRALPWAILFHAFSGEDGLQIQNFFH